MLSDNWSQRRRHPQPSCLGIDLNKSRNVSFLLLGGTLLSAFVLTARYHLAHPDDHPLGTGPRNIGSQAFQPSFRLGAATASTGADAAAAQDDDDWGADEWTLPWQSDAWNPTVNDPAPIVELRLLSCFTPPGLWNLCVPAATASEETTRGKWTRIDKDLNKRTGVSYLYLFTRRLLPNSKLPVVTNITFLKHKPTAEDLDDGVWVETSESLRTGVWPRMDPMFMHYRLTPQAEVLAARRSGNGSAGDLEPITELDVLYGGAEVQAPWGFEKMRTMITGGEDDAGKVDLKTRKGRPGSTLAVRKAIVPLPPTPELQFSERGEFTILQVADLHFSTGPGECRDMDAARKIECEAVGADVYSLLWLETALAEVKPDLVVFSGDQLNGQTTSWSSQSTILKWAPVIWKKGIPWTAIYGNHDAEDGMSNAESMEYMRSMPYFLGEAGPVGVDGTGNYMRSIRSHDSSNTTLFNLYFLDSGSYIKTISPWGKDYDYIKPSQINWFRSQSAQVKPILRPYSPRDSTAAPVPAPFDDRNRRLSLRQKRQDDDDRGSEEDALDAAEEDGEGEGESEGLLAAAEEDAGAQVGTSDPDAEYRPSDEAYLDQFDEIYDAVPMPTELPVGPTASAPLLAKPNAITFFHIPLPEAYDTPADVGAKLELLIVGNRLEGAGASKVNSNFFEQALMAQGELVATGSATAPVDEFWDGEFSQETSGRPEIKVLAHGHCHLSEDCRRIKGVWVCFGGGGSYAGYGQAGFSRRMRVFTLSDFGEKIGTFELLDTKERIDEVVLTGEGALE